LVRSARKAIVLADSHKLGVRAAVNVCSLGEMDTVITDVKASKQAVKALEQAGVRVIIAKM
jgi:DeoR/GlpR family transcriptional regulator of sugar metabolism